MPTQPNNSQDIDIEFRGVTKRFADVVAVDDVSISVERGSFFSFLGPSGCGKTTSLRLIAGFEQPTAGDVMIGGRSVVGVPPFKRPVNMVFQHYALFPHFTVADNIGYGLRQQKPRPDKQEIARRVGETLELVRLDGYERRRIWELSGGQQQRVALARALINRPTVLLLDEPLAALDRKLRQEMQIELQTLQRDVGITFVLVTHDQEEALSMSDTICIMHEGHIVQIGEPRQLYDDPINHYVADFVGKSNFFWGTVEEVNGAVAAVTIDSGLKLSGRLPKGGRSLSPGDSAAIAVRPEVVLIGRPGAEALAATDVRAPARIKNRIFLGEQTEYLVAAERLGDVLVLSSKHNETVTGRLSTGDSVEIGWRTESTLALEKT
ncbi:MAG: ABC transporter ATP-binding protein [Gammaproteobacteria bacterium]|nr:ABC transporter ATP-binding protein [Gammaproteobacteria bacterium]